MRKRTFFYPMKLVGKRSLFCVCVLCVALSAFAQPPDVVWTRVFGDQDWNDGFEILNAPAGGFVVGGTLGRPGDSLYTGVLIRFDEIGDTLWTQAYSDSNVFSIRSTKIFPDGRIAFAGRMRTTITHLFAGIADPDGEIIDISPLPSFRPWWEELEVTSDGELIVAGGEPFGAHLPDAFIVKLSENGEIEWSENFGGFATDLFEAVEQLPDSGFVAAGSTGANDLAFYLVRVDANGDSLWTRTYHFENARMWCHDLALADDGGYVMVGSISGHTTPDDDILILKADSAGNYLWHQTYGGQGDDVGAEIKLLSDGGYIIAGQYDSPIAGNQEAYLIRTDSEGDSIWTKAFGLGQSGDFAYSVAVVDDNEYAITGFTYSLIDSRRRILVARLGNASSVMNPPHANPISIALLPAFPIPFNSSVSIPLELSKPQLVDIRIYNVLGQEVYSFGRKMLLPGRQELVWEGVTNSGVGLASGVYVVQARTASEVKSVKVELIR